MDIRSMTDLSAAKKTYSAGDTARFTVVRGGQTLEIPVTWGAEPASAAAVPQGSRSQAGQAYGGRVPFAPGYGE